MIGQSSPTDPQDAFAQTLRGLQARIDDLERRKPTAFSVSGGLLSMTVSGTVTAANLAGSGSAITNLNASNLASGTVPSARLSGSYSISVPAANLTGTTLASVVTASSLTSVGTLTALTVSGQIRGTTGEAVRLTASNPFITFYDSGVTARVGYLQGVNGSDMRLVSEAGTLFCAGNTFAVRDGGMAANRLVVNSTNVNSSIGFYASGGGYTGRAAAGFGPFSTDNRAPALLSGAGTNWIHFNWDTALRIYVDSTLVKTFVIDHPDDSDKYLVHACAEGPTADVFYRGEARLEEGIVRIDLPDYFESLTELDGRTVQITPIIEHGEAWKTANLAASRVENGCFWVFQTGGMMNNEQPFWWRVDAVRKGTGFDVEPRKDAVTVAGSGPYTYIAPRAG